MLWPLGGYRVLCWILILGLAIWLFFTNGTLAEMLTIRELKCACVVGLLFLCLCCCHRMSVSGIYIPSAWAPEWPHVKQTWAQPRERRQAQLDLKLETDMSSLTWLRINDCCAEPLSFGVAYFTTMTFTITMRGSFEIMGHRIALCPNYQTNADWITADIFKVTMMERMAFRQDQCLTNGTDLLR